MAGSSSAPALPGKSESEKEEMLDRMLTRLALCEDSNLQNLLSKLLPLSISFLSSNSTPVRNKVVEILSHVNKRVKHQLDIGLPLSELWNLYIEPNAAPMVRNFCIVYIEMAFERVQIEVKEDMVPLLVSNISKLPTQHQEIILRISAKVIGDCHCTHLRDDIAAKYRLIKGSQDSEIFLEFCLHTMLYQSPSQGGGSPAGLSISQSNRVSGKQLLTSDILSKRKLGILNVVEAMELVPEIVYPLFLVACVDCHEPVIKRGEELLKKKASGVNLEDQSLINRLYLLFNGCNVYGNASLGNLVSKQILATEAENAGTYILQANIYSSSGNYREAANIRMKMKDKGLKKQPGCSWIEIGNRFHVFVVGDKSHSDTKLIYNLLGDIHAKMKKNSYVQTDGLIMEEEFLVT